MAGDGGTESGGYVSVGLLARGGMGDVELGIRRTGSFHRLVAIKRLRAEHRDDPSFRRMFLDEAKIAGLIRHPNVVSVLDVGTDKRGPFLVMDFVEGVTAARVLKGVSSEGEMLPVQLATRIIHQVAKGLAAAHALCGSDGEALGLIHRDVSPQNVLIGFDGVTRLTDFGIAKALGQKNQHQTTTGLLKGKVGYMSPEQLRFERPTQRSDLFPLGVLLFELLSSKRLYAGKDTVEVAQLILSEPAPDIYAFRDDVPAELVELLFELLAKAPESRPESAKEVAKRLSAVIDELVAEEGTLPLDEFLTTRFADDQTSIREKSSSMVSLWETKTRHSGTPRSIVTRRALLAIAAVSVVAIAISLGVLVSDGGSEPDVEAPLEAGAPSAPPPEETAAVEAAVTAIETPASSGREAEAVEAVVSEEVTAEQPVVGETPEKAAMSTRRRRGRMISRMRDERIRAADHAVEF